MQENKNAELTETIKNNNKNIISAMANDQDIVNVKYNTKVISNDLYVYM